MQGLLADRRRSRLMFEGPSSWRVKLVFEVVRDEPGITAQTFANYDGDPMRHPIVTRALARELVSITNGVPAQAAAAEDAVGRISDVLQIDAGQNLIFGPAPVKAELEAWAAIARDKRITDKTFTSANPFANPLLMDRIAPLYAAARPRNCPAKACAIWSVLPSACSRPCEGRPGHCGRPRRPATGFGARKRAERSASGAGVPLHRAQPVWERRKPRQNCVEG